MTRFSTTNEIRQKLDCVYGNLLGPDADKLEFSGPVLGYKSLPFEEIYIDSSEHHVGIVGSTGYGKSRRAYSTAVLAAIRMKENIAVIDTKAEHLHNFSPIVEKFGYRRVVIDLNNPQFSAGYNPLEYVTYLYHNGEKDKAAIERRKISNMLTPKDTPNSDPFWSVSGKNILFGSIMALLETADEGQVNFASLLKFINDSAKKDVDGTCLVKFLKALPDDSVARTALEDYSTTATTTAAGMRSYAAQALQEYAFSDGVNAMLANSDIKISRIGDDLKQPVIYFVVLPEQNNALFPVASLFFSQLINRYIQVADRQAGGRLSRRLNLFIDELPAMARSLSDNFANYISTCRSRNIRIYYVIQSFEQLTAAFGNQANTILDNTGTMIIFRVNTDSSARYITDMLGKYNYTNKYSGESITRDVITTSNISSMDVGQAVIVSNGLRFISWLPDYTEIVPPKYTELPALPQKPKKRKPIGYFEMRDYFKKDKAKEKPVRNMGSFRSDDGDIISGCTVDDVFYSQKPPQIYIGNFNNNNGLRDAIVELHTNVALKGVTDAIASQIEKEVKSFTKRRIQHKYKVDLIFLGHDKEFIFSAARICKVTVSSMLTMLHDALDEPMEFFFEDRAMAENFAGEVESSGGIAEFIVLYDEE